MRNAPPRSRRGVCFRVKRNPGSSLVAESVGPLAIPPSGALPGSFGIGVPFGGGIIHHPDGTVEPVGRSAVEFRVEDNRIVESILYPPDGSQGDVVPPA